MAIRPIIGSTLAGALVVAGLTTSVGPAQAVTDQHLAANGSVATSGSPERTAVLNYGFTKRGKTSSFRTSLIRLSKKHYGVALRANVRPSHIKLRNTRTSDGSPAPKIRKKRVARGTVNTSHTVRFAWLVNQKGQGKKRVVHYATHFRPNVSQTSVVRLPVRVSREIRKLQRTPGVDKLRLRMKIAPHSSAIPTSMRATQFRILGPQPRSLWGDIAVGIGAVAVIAGGIGLAVITGGSAVPEEVAISPEIASIVEGYMAVGDTTGGFTGIDAFGDDLF